ncbi:MAG: autotransporter-associated beta strand repeat-containing protein, partial [Planctomycetes bacterium]|nr:autotransporter-associated beta strand repeat-containing protein [Planctomycetota bacterium]
MGNVRFQGGVTGLVAAMLCLVPAAAAFGLVMHPGDDTPPALRPGDGAVGRWVDNGSCVAVAPNYVVTTRHQHYDYAGTSVVIDGVGYLTAEIFNHYEADIRVVRIVTPAGLPANLSYYIAPYTGSAEKFKNAVIGGYGKGRGDTLLTPGGVAYGYTWAGTANTTLRWGANRIDDTPVAPVNQTYRSYILQADFDATNGFRYVEHEAAPGDWDSGGGWFIDVSPDNSGDWRLAGLTRATEHGSIGQTWFRDLDGNLDSDYIDAVRVSPYAAWMSGILNTTTWAGDSSGNWSDGARWSAAVPNTKDLWVAFGSAITADRTVTVGSAYKVGTLRFDDDNGYTLSGAGSLTFEASDNGECRIEVNRERKTGRHGAHTIAVPLALADDLILNQRSDGVFVLAGGISGAYRLTKTGEGTAVLAASNGFSGGLTIEQGTLRVTAAGGLGTGPVTFGTGLLDLRNNAATTFANSLTVTGNVGLNVQSNGGGADHVITLAGLTVAGNRTLTLTGADGYDLAFSGAASFNVVTTVLGVNTASADLTLAGGLTMLSGTVAKSGPHTLAVGGTQVYGEGAAYEVSAGTLRLNSDAGSAATHNLTVRLTGPAAAAEFASTQHLLGLEVGTGEVTLLSGGSPVLMAESLTLGTGGRLDVGTGAAIIDYVAASPLGQVADWLTTGCAGGAWDGVGIRSSVAAIADMTAVGVLDNTDADVGGLTTFVGQAVDATSVLVRYTYWGDANLDGVVDANDYDVVDKNYLFQPVPDAMGWWTGDFNYDGVIDANDYDRIDKAYL